MYSLHTLFCLTCFCLSPPSRSLIFPFHWQDAGRRRRAEFEGGMTVQRRAEKRQTSPAGSSAAIHPSSFLTITGFCLPGHVPLIWVICSSGVDQVQHKAQSDIKRGGSSAPPIFPIHQPRQNCSRAPACCQTEGSAADCNLAGVLTMEGNYFWLFVVVLWLSRKTTNVVGARVV